MIRLCLNGEEYLSSVNDRSNTNNPFESGHISGIYFGSSTRISGGEIWHPQKGYLPQRISIQTKLPEESTWKTLFEQDVDFLEESIKLEEIDSNMWFEFQKKIAQEKGKEFDTKKFIENKNKTIEGIRTGTICKLCSGTKITIKNESYEVILFFRDLHRYEGEVQISGCRYKLIQ
jgi:hypothetical protein